ncbi:MFS transporter [Providencia sneebia]|uniref:Sugar transporter n=1 Tax=Providencia sneebia DSM 19967 TaxID=1141660 RepID=K8WII6_9GAMM|nr:MFS transporter [Providencia sneebia]EKT57312.1 sugar transporter [Providencia sneebia DSM 19967]
MKNISMQVTDIEQPKVPIKLGIALSLGALLWLSGYLGTLTVLLPARIAIIDDSQKATLLATISSLAMIVATLANIIMGALSDITRSSLGRRTPWLIIGSVGASAMLVCLSYAETLTSILIIWLIYQIFLNCIVAPMVAIIADKIAPRHRGVISSFYAVGISVGLYGGTFIAAHFIDNISFGIYVMAGMTLLSGLLCSILIKEGSSKCLEATALDFTSLIKNFIPPVTDCRDYYLALIGKLLMVTGTSVISGLLLYILTDYSGLKSGSDDIKYYLSVISIIMMVTGLIMAACAGYIADKIGYIKLPVVFTCIITTIGLFFPFISHEPWTLLVYAALAGMGYGAFQSVDQALNVAVLPNPAHAARDLGILNLSNTVGQILGPVFAAAAISFYGYNLLFPVAGCLSILGAILIMLIRKVK